MDYMTKKLRCRTTNSGKTMTDQSAAKDTDRNIIVQRFMTHGQLPGGTRPPIYADFTHLPRDLQGFLKRAQSVSKLRESLPPVLQDLTLDALLALTPEQLTDKLKKPEDPAKPKEEPK